MPNLQLYLPIIHETAAVLYQSLNLQNYVNYNADERNQIIENYWGSLTEMQIYPLGFRAIELMFDKSYDTKTIALHVTHIDNKNKVEAEWMPVQVKQMGNVQMYDFALNISDEQHYYFILKRSFYNNETIPNTIATKGIKAATKSFSNVVFATIGKNQDGSHCVFINAGRLDFIDGDEGTGGNGYTPGVKVPSPPPPSL